MYVCSVCIYIYIYIKYFFKDLTSGHVEFIPITRVAQSCCLVSQAEFNLNAKTFIG